MSAKIRELKLEDIKTVAGGFSIKRFAKGVATSFVDIGRTSVNTSVQVANYGMEKVS